MQLKQQPYSIESAIAPFRTKKHRLQNWKQPPTPFEPDYPNLTTALCSRQHFLSMPLTLMESIHTCITSDCLPYDTMTTNCCRPAFSADVKRCCTSEYVQAIMGQVRYKPFTSCVRIKTLRPTF